MPPSNRKADNQLLDDLLKTPMASEPKKSRYELSIDLIRAVAWPLFAFVVLVGFWRPFQNAAQLLPDIINRSNTITIAGLTIEIDRSLRGQGVNPTPEVRQVLSQLSPDGIRELLRMSGEVGCTAEGAASCQSSMAELVRHGLVTELSPEELAQKRDFNAYAARITPLGKATQDYLFALVGEFTQQLGQQQPTATPVP